MCREIESRSGERGGRREYGGRGRNGAKVTQRGKREYRRKIQRWSYGTWQE